VELIGAGLGDHAELADGCRIPAELLVESSRGLSKLSMKPIMAPSELAWCELTLMPSIE